MKKDVKNKTDRKKDLKDIEEDIVVDQEKIIEDLQQKSGEYLDGWKRCQADFENYKKQQTQSQQEMVKYASSSVILQVIPVLDNFHASTDHIPEDQKDNPWVTGIMYIQKQLETVLSDNGVEAIEPKAGEEFDPTMHEAVSDSNVTNEHANDSNEEGKIVKVVLKGYKMGERIIRAARVVVN
jgi:molecular chaperone GrpE